MYSPRTAFTLSRYLSLSVVFFHFSIYSLNTSFISIDISTDFLWLKIALLVIYFKLLRITNIPFVRPLFHFIARHMFYITFTFPPSSTTMIPPQRPLYHCLYLTFTISVVPLYLLFYRICVSINLYFQYM